MMCPQSAYSLNLEPCDFSLFPKVKITMNARHYESIQDIKVTTVAQLKILMRGRSELLLKVVRMMR